jgi:hypothetical protein
MMNTVRFNFESNNAINVGSRWMNIDDNLQMVVNIFLAFISNFLVSNESHWVANFVVLYHLTIALKGLFGVSRKTVNQPSTKCQKDGQRNNSRLTC